MAEHVFVFYAVSVHVNSQPRSLMVKNQQIGSEKLAIY